MSTRLGLLLMTNEAETAGAVASALEQNGQFTAEAVCRDLQQLVAHLEDGFMPAVLVDIDPQPKRTLALLDPIIARFAYTRFVVLSASRGDDLLLEAMQTGARHFLVKRSIETDLADVLGRLIPDGSIKGVKKGAIITVLSAGGGCGATTIAVNLANELQLASSQPALLVDLDRNYGAVASYLGLEGQYGLADVLADRSRIDSQLIRSTSLAYSTGLQVLISPASVNFGEPAPIEFEHLEHALEACKRTYGYTVIDAPRVPLEVAADLARASQAVLVVFQLMVKDIRLMRSLLSALTKRGVAADRIVPLANRYRKRRSMITLKEAEAALGGVSFGRISNDFRSAIRGINYGQPLAQAAPRSALRRELQRLAQQVLQADLYHLDGSTTSGGKS